MSTAIVTGASRGLGLALARALGARGWRLVVDARGVEALELAARELGAARGRRRDRRRRRRPRAPPRAGRRRRRRTSTCSSTTRACSARARSRALADYPLDELERVYRVNVLAPLALVQLALPLLPAGGRDRQRHLRRGGRAVRGLGRLRLLEGGARAADRDPRRRAPRAARSTPSTPATCARGCTRRRSPARTSPTARRPRTACPGCCADRGRPRRAAATAPPRLAPAAARA